MKARVFDVLTESYKPVRVSCNVNILNMACKDIKKEIFWFWKTELVENKKRDKQDPEEKVPAINSG